MMKIKENGSFRLVALFFVAILVLGACKKEAEFKIEGNVADGEGKTLILSKADFAGRWVMVDSTVVDKSGKFSITSPSPGSPDIYRLQLEDNFIYLPIDSVETLKVETSAADFGHKFTVTGTPQAEKMCKFEQELMNLNMSDSVAVKQFKRDVYSNYIKDSQGAIISYYVLTKFIDKKPLFDPSNREDLKYYTAVATQYDQFNAADPHGKMVKDAALEGLRAYNKSQGRVREIAAPELKVLEIELPDERGENRKLSDVVGKGAPTIVVFGMMNSEKSPTFNRGLADFRTSHPGVQIYHVSFDADNYAWRDAAANLPWITVLDAQGLTSTVARDYNISVLPVFYLYDSNGELKDSAFDFNELNKKYSKL